MTTNKHADIKSKVRKSKKWLEFREKLIREQKNDPITGKKLQKRLQLSS